MPLTSLIVRNVLWQHAQKNSTSLRSGFTHLSARAVLPIRFRWHIFASAMLFGIYTALFISTLFKKEVPGRNMFCVGLVCAAFSFRRSECASEFRGVQHLAYFWREVADASFRHANGNFDEV